MTAFQLDTSGRVVTDLSEAFETYYEWSHLTPFAQGYVEAMFADGVADCKSCAGNGEVVTNWDRYLKGEPGDVGDEATATCPDCDGQGKADLGSFSDLAPATLARIIGDCERRLSHYPSHATPNLFIGRTTDCVPRQNGARFWQGRQAGRCKNFTPLTPYLGEDGLIYLREAA